MNRACSSYIFPCRTLSWNEQRMMMHLLNSSGTQEGGGAIFSSFLPCHFIFLRLLFYCGWWWQVGGGAKEPEESVFHFMTCMLWLNLTPPDWTGDKSMLIIPSLHPRMRLPGGWTKLGSAGRDFVPQHDGNSWFLCFQLMLQFLFTSQGIFSPPPPQGATCFVF